MYTKTKLSWTVLLVGCVLVGCSDSGAPSVDNSAVVAEQPIPDRTVYYATDLSHLSPQKSAEITATAAMSASEALHGQDDWREANRDLKRIIASAPEGQEALYREVAGNDYLYWFQENTTSDPEALDVVAHHTKALIAVQSPSAELLLASLRSLEGYWTEDQLQDAAAKAADAGEAHVLENCASCNGNLMVAAGVEDARDVNERLRAKARAVSALRDLSE